jgi:hypothetical protein
MMLGPQLLRESPQLAALELLIQAADTTVVALCAVHRGLEHELRPDPQPVVDRLADRLVDRIACMRDGIHRYCRALDDLQRLRRLSLDDDHDPDF